jgi:hypothetical protein
MKRYGLRKMRRKKKEEISLSINTEEVLEWHQREASPNIRNSPWGLNSHQQYPDPILIRTRRDRASVQSEEISSDHRFVTTHSMPHSTRYCSPSKPPRAKKCRSINQNPRSSIESITVFIHNKARSAYIGRKIRNKTRHIHGRFIRSELVYTETGCSGPFNNRGGIHCSTQRCERCSLGQIVDEVDWDKWIDLAIEYSAELGGVLENNSRV